MSDILKEMAAKFEIAASGDVVRITDGMGSDYEITPDIFEKMQGGDFSDVDGIRFSEPFMNEIHHALTV